MATEVFLLCVATVVVNDSLTYDWSPMAKKILEKTETDGK